MNPTIEYINYLISEHYGTIFSEKQKIYKGSASEKQLSFVEGLLKLHGYQLEKDELDKFDCHCIIEKLHNNSDDMVINLQFSRICIKDGNFRIEEVTRRQIGKVMKTVKEQGYITAQQYNDCFTDLNDNYPLYCKIKERLMTEKLAMWEVTKHQKGILSQFNFDGFPHIYVLKENIQKLHDIEEAYTYKQKKRIYKEMRAVVKELNADRYIFKSALSERLKDVVEEGYKNIVTPLFMSELFDIYGLQECTYRQYREDRGMASGEISDRKALVMMEQYVSTVS